MKDNLPGVSIKVMNDVKSVIGSMNPVVYGAFKNGGILLETNTKTGTTYHEAFHAVFWLGLNNRERQNVLKEAKEKYGDLSNLELEELLAEDFINFVETSNNEDIGKSTLKWYQKLWGWIKAKIFSNPSIDYLYNKINTGGYKYIKSHEIDIVRGRSDSYFNPLELEDRVDSLLAVFSEIIDNFIAKNPQFKNYTRVQVLNDEKLIEAVKKKGFNTPIEMFLSSARNSIHKLYIKNKGDNETLDNIRKKFIIESVNKGKNNKIVFGPIGKRALEKLGAVEGFTVDLNKTDNVITEAIKDIEEDIVTLEGWQINNVLLSGEMGLSSEIRKELSYIPLIKNGEKVVDPIINFPKYLDFHQVYGFLKTEMSDIDSANLMIEKLESIINYKPEYQGLLDKLNSDKGFKTKFFVDMFKTHAKAMRTIQLKNGAVLLKPSNGADINAKLIDTWETSFYQKGFINNDGKIVKEEITKFREKVAGKKFSIILDSFDNTFGLNLDKNTKLEILNDTESVNNVKQLISDILKGINVFEENKARLNNLAKIESKYKSTLLESSFRNVNGETQYSHIIPNFVSKQITRIKQFMSSKENLDKFNEYYMSDPFYKNSPLANDLIKNKKLRDNLDWSMSDGHIYRGKTDGIGYVDMSDKDYLTHTINTWFNNGNKNFGWYQTPILADSSQGIFVQLPKYKLVASEKTEGILDKLYQVAEQERARIKNNIELGIKSYDNNKDKFLFLDFLTVKDFDEKTAIEIKELIKDNLNKKFEEYFKLVTKNELLNNEDFLLHNSLAPKGYLAKNIKAEKLQEYKEELKDTIREYYFNQVYASSQIISLTTGDPAFYKNVVDFYKRSKEIISPGLGLDTSASYELSDSEMKAEGINTSSVTSGEIYRTLYVNDVEVPAKIAGEFWDMYQQTNDIEYAKLAAQYGYSNYTNKEGSEFVKIEQSIEGKKKAVYYKSQNVNVADAQTFITPQRYRKVNIGLGRWDSQSQATFAKIVNNKKLDTEDYNVVFNPLKPFYFGHTKVGNKIVPVQNKNSEYMLTPQLAEASPTLKKLYNLLQDKGIDSVSFSSVVKVGGSNMVNWNDALEGQISEENIHTLLNKDYVLQQETPEHYIDSSSLFGSQIRKLILSNINLEGNYNINGETKTGKELFDEYQELITQNVIDAYNDTLEKMGFNEDQIDVKKLSKLLVAEAIERDLGRDVIEAVSLNADGKFNLHLSDPTHADRIEKLFNSIFKNKVTKQKIKGGSYIQASGIGFTDNLNINVDKTIGRIKEVECMLPWSSRKYFEPFMGNKGYIDIKKVPEPLLNMVGYRIPTEDKYSMLPLKVAGFLPSNAGGSVMLPIEITTLAGSDFDVDKLYIMMPEFGVTSNYDFNKLVPELKERGFSQITAGYLGDLFKRVNTGEKLSQRDLEVWDEIDLKLRDNSEFKKSIQKIFKINNTESVKGRNNRLIDIIQGILTSEHAFKQAVTPGSFAVQQREANIISLVANFGKNYKEIDKKSDEELQNLMDSELQKEGLDFTSPLSNAKVFRRNMTGKQLVGIEANHSVAHSMLQFTDIKLATNVIFTYGNEEHILSSLNNTKDINDEYISFGGEVAMATDNAKEPNAFKINLNTYTADVEALLHHLGVPIKYRYALLKQPSVRRLADLYFKHGGGFRAEVQAINEMYKFYGLKKPNISKLSDNNPYSLDELIKELNNPSKVQADILTKFLIYKNQANGLAELIRATKGDTNGAGPYMADNEILLRLQRKILEQEEDQQVILNAEDLFINNKYPFFKALNDYGIIGANNQLKRVLPLGNTDKNSVVYKATTLLENSILKSNLTTKDINTFKKFILSNIARKFDFYNQKDFEVFIKSFPEKYNSILSDELKEKYKILKYLEYKKDSKYPYPRIELDNANKFTPVLLDEIKNSWFAMFSDSNPEISKLARSLVKYAYYKDGFIFGPKSFSYLIPTKFFTEVSEGIEVRNSWHKALESTDISLMEGEITTLVDQFIQNNYKQYAATLGKTESGKWDATTVNHKQGVVNSVIFNIKNDDQFVKGGNFVKFVKAPYSQTNPDGSMSNDYILLKRNDEVSNPYNAVYTPISKLGSKPYLLELNPFSDNMSSILKGNNLLPKVNEKIQQQIEAVKADTEIDLVKDENLSVAEKIEQQKQRLDQYNRPLITGEMIENYELTEEQKQAKKDCYGS